MLTLADLSNLAEEVNKNVELLVKPMMEKFEKALEDGTLDSLSVREKQLAQQRRFDDLLARVQDSIFRTYGVTKQSVEEAGMRAALSMAQNDGDPQNDADAKEQLEALERFERAIAKLERLRWIATGSRQPLGKETAPAPVFRGMDQSEQSGLALGTVLQILTETFEAMNKSMEECCAEYSTAADREKASQAILQCFTIKNEMVSIDVQRKHGVDGHNLALAFEEQSDDAQFQSTLHALMAEQQKRFKECGAPLG